MAELKTKKSDASVSDFVAAIADEQQRDATRQFVKIFQNATGNKPKMWGNIIGFGDQHLVYDSGRELDWFLVGLAPRKGSVALYIKSDASRYSELVNKLGKHKMSGSCMHVKRLEDIDLKVLAELVKVSVQAIKKKK